MTLSHRMRRGMRIPATSNKGSARMTLSLSPSPGQPIHRHHLLFLAPRLVLRLRLALSVIRHSVPSTDLYWRSSIGATHLQDEAGKN